MTVTALPYISVAGVEAALSSTRYTASEKSFDAMLALAVVDEYMLHHDIPHSNRRRHFALQNILLDTLIAGYAHHRQQILQESLSTPNTIDELEAIITTDAMSDNSELMAWSLLYAKYGTVLLSDVSMDELAASYNVVKRTVRRYIKYGYRVLTDALIIREHEARQQIHQRRLTTNLPFAKAPFHVGRKQELTRLKTVYQSQKGVCLLITGEQGIGKTHLCDVFLRQQLHQPYAPQHLVWMHRPASLQSIIARLNDQLLRNTKHINLSDYAQVHRVTLVLDNADTILSDLPMLSATLRQVDILVCARQCYIYKVLQHFDEHIH